MNLRVFNNITKTKEVFTPLVKNHIGIYVCGPTVSGESHLGHARPFITFDFIFRYFVNKGFRVRYVRNITDAGHFEEEGRDAEDKISSKATIEKLEPMELVQKYTNLFHSAMKELNCLEPSIEPTATGHILEQIEMIEKIISEGYAYEVNGSVYFDVLRYNSKFNYGVLSKRKIEDLINNTRKLESQEEKRNPLDFALWKKAHENHLMRWKSPWGYGFPGWHIECSAMGTKYLGKRFDIHGGGMDLQFPHHDCEIAQSQIANGCIPAKYWLHNNMITINGKKMGKSYDNVITLSQIFRGNHGLISQPIKPSTVRFFVLQTHYRSTLDFSEDALLASEKALIRIQTAYQLLQNFKEDLFSNSTHPLDEQICHYLDLIDTDLDDDFNTPKVLSSFFELVLIINSIQSNQIPKNQISGESIKKLKYYFKTYLEDILGINLNISVNDTKLTKVVNILVDLRNNFKADKKFNLTDSIREKLESIGIKLRDNKDGGTDFYI